MCLVSVGFRYMTATNRLFSRYAPLADPCVNRIVKSGLAWQLIGQRVIDSPYLIGGLRNMLHAISVQLRELFSPL